MQNTRKKQPTQYCKQLLLIKTAAIQHRVQYARTQHTDVCSTQSAVDGNTVTAVITTTLENLL